MVRPAGAMPPNMDAPSQTSPNLVRLALPNMGRLTRITKMLAGTASPPRSDAEGSDVEQESACRYYREQAYGYYGEQGHRYDREQAYVSCVGREAAIVPSYMASYHRAVSHMHRRGRGCRRPHRHPEPLPMRASS